MKGLPLAACLLASACLHAPNLPSQDPQPPTSRPQDSLRERALRAERTGELEAAANLYLELVAAEPTDPRWAVAAGRCLGLVGRFNDAMDLLEDKRAKYPDVHELSAMLARTYLLKAETLDPRVEGLGMQLLYEDACKVAEAILQQQPDHRDSRLILAQSRYQLGQWDAAVEQAEEAARRHPDHPGAHIVLGRIAFDRFRSLRSRLIAESPQGEEQLALIAAVDRLRKQARAAFLRAIQLDPTRAFPHQQLGDLAAWEGHIDEALRHYRDALVIDPQARVNHDWVTQNVAIAQRLDLYRQALAAYRERPSSDPAKAAALQWYVAKTLLDSGEFQAARVGFEQVLAAQPGLTSAAYFAALAAYRSDDHDGAERHAATYASTAGAAAFADVIRGLPKEQLDEMVAIVRYLADRAFTAERIGHSRELNEVLAYVSNTADAWNNFALLCRDTGQPARSLQAYEYALELEPNSPQLLNDAGVILQYHLPSEENLATARKYYERALREAARVLADPKAGAEQQQRARQARLDAQANLAKL